MAELNLDYYRGSDQYSDGDVEDRILGDVRKLASARKAAEAPGSQSDAQDMLYGVIDEAYRTGNETDGFAYLYHLSPVRENILSWYPFRKDAAALEIGAGPGAVTGILCKKMASVTSVDLSKRRCMINYERHRCADNLKIMVGNLNEMKFPGLFDYVILNGVFEYAGSFTKEGQPYRTFLRRCAGFLKEDGVLLVAIENRLGLKYFAGAPEDHTGNYMEGLKGYRQGSGVRTFSRAEWLDLASDCGLRVRRFYYPSPDYKFPGEVFTDETLSAASYDRNRWNFDARRLELFPECEMAASLQKEGVLASFMNSFLVELSASERLETPEKTDGGSEVLYAKVNSDRASCFRIQTVIRRTGDGKRVVSKEPLTDAARAHLLRMHEYEKAQETRTLFLEGRQYPVRTLCGEEKDGRLFYRYLEGENLGERVARAAEAGDDAAVIRMTDALWSLLLQGKVEDGRAGKEGRDAFRKVFGEEPGAGEGSFLCPANIDLIFDNLILSGDTVWIIDGEWVFDFPVPAGFILWRAVNELYAGHESLERVLPRQKLLGRYQITPAQAQTYWKWADFFEKQTVKANELARYARPEKKADLKDIHTFGQEARLTSTLYMDRGQGFSEKDVVRQEVSLKDGVYEAVFDIPHPETVRDLRFDPVEGTCCVCALSSPDGQLRPVNAARARKKIPLEGGYTRVCEFLTTDPSYRLVCRGSIPERIRIAGRMDLRSEDWALGRAGSLLGKYQRIFRL